MNSFCAEIILPIIIKKLKTQTLWREKLQKTLMYKKLLTNISLAAFAQKFFQQKNYKLKL